MNKVDVSRVQQVALLGMAHTLRRSKHHTPLAERLADETRPSSQPVEALQIRLALARTPVDREFAERLRLAVLEAEVAERLRML